MTSKHSRNFVIVFWLILVVCATPVQAVQFRLLAWGSYDLNLQFQDGKAPQEITVFPTSFSNTYESTTTGPIVLFKMVDVDGKPQRQTACTITIQPEIQQGLVILVPGDDSKALSRKVLPNSQGLVSKDAALIYDYVVIDDSPAAHPRGTIEFRNFSKRSIAINIAQQQLTLSPRDKAQVPITAGAKRMPFRAAAQLEDGQWKLLGSNPLPISSADRILVILRDGPAKATKPDEPNIAIVPLFDWTPPAPEIKPPVIARQ